MATFPLVPNLLENTLLLYRLLEAPESGQPRTLVLTLSSTIVSMAASHQFPLGHIYRGFYMGVVLAGNGDRIASL
jgi:hypothetical protein